MLGHLLGFHDNGLNDFGDIFKVGDQGLIINGVFLQLGYKLLQSEIKRGQKRK